MLVFHGTSITDRDKYPQTYLPLIESHSSTIFSTYLVDGDPVDISVVHKPDDLVGEQFTIVLRGQVWLSGL